ncbi:MAG: hypothetical protein IPM57_08095 [Oligoflexia bacterium]|nr:hypothetical protein [Oligoflexia bacterium]
MIHLLLLLSLNLFARDVEFSWAPMPQAIKYEIQISNTIKFENTLAKEVVEKPMFATKLEVGRYYYKVRVIDLKGRPGKWSKPATVLVDPYSPELILPENGHEVSYFEVLPEVKFEWKTEHQKMSYEVLVSKTTGEKVLEEKVNDFTLIANKLPEGEYNWKVRTVSETVSSAYTEPRRFNIIKKPLQTPKLIKPENDGMSAAYRKVDFTWEQDPVAKFTDFYFEKIKSYTNDSKPFKIKKENLTTTSYTDPYQEPGLYKWWVTTKEAQNTPGVTSEVNNFELRNDVLSQGNYELEFSLSYLNDQYTTTSARSDGLTQIAQQSMSSGVFVGFLGGYYILEGLGIYLSQRTAKVAVENFNDLISETDLQFRLRFGSKGFNQEFQFGYRVMDIIEAENTPSVTSTAFTTLGPLIGTRMTATIIPTIKAQLSGFYFKPFSNVQSIGGLTADIFGGSLGVKWNFMYQFWLGYKFSFEQINGIFQTPGQPSSYNASWTQYRTEPFYISLSFEH